MDGSQACRVSVGRPLVQYILQHSTQGKTRSASRTAAPPCATGRLDTRYASDWMLSPAVRSSRDWGQVHSLPKDRSLLPL